MTLEGDQTWALNDHLEVNQQIDLNNHTLTMGGLVAVQTTRSPMGHGAIVKIGPASWDSSLNPGDAGFFGPITVEEGRVWALAPGALGVEDGTDANGTTVKSGATLQISNYGAGLNEAITLNGSGLLSRGALAFADSNTQTVTAPITLATSATISTHVVTFLPGHERVSWRDHGRTDVREDRGGHAAADGQRGARLGHGRWRRNWRSRASRSPRRT